MTAYQKSQANYFSSSVNPQTTYYSNTKNYNLDHKLWQPSQTSLNFISPKLSIGKSQRFKLHSIYWPQYTQINNQSTKLFKQRSQIDSIAKQISKKIDDQLLNQIRIKRKSSHNQKRITNAFSQTTKRKKQQFKRQMKRFILDQKNAQITQRLSTSPKRQSFLRDRHGFRSNLVQGQDQHLHNVVKCQVQRLAQTNGFSQRTRNPSKMISTSKRMNLNLPHNYYPGVGTYEIKRYLQELDDLGKRRALTARQNNKKQSDKHN